MNTFEFDPNKSLSNADKHGIDFEQAQALWDDPDLLIIDSKALDEHRQLVIGIIDGKHCSAIITDRPPNTRIISVRRSRKSEVDIYEGK